MRNKRLKVTLGFAALACAVCVGAASASAAEFEASAKTGTGVTKGVGFKSEVFNVYPMTVGCFASTTKGSVALGKPETFTTVVTYSQCSTFEGRIKATVSPGHFEYNADGTVAITEPIKIIPTALKCHYEIPAQSSFTLDSVLYGDLTAYNKEGKSHQKLQIESAVEGMEYTAYGWPCIGPKSPPEKKEAKEIEESGTEGTFSSKIQEEVVGLDNNFTWIP